jgi:hypothetical protein
MGHAFIKPTSNPIVSFNPFHPRFQLSKREAQWFDPIKRTPVSISTNLPFG